MAGAVHIWTDGSAYQGVAGVAALLVRRRSLRIVAGPVEVDGCTNQRAELIAATIALANLPNPSRVTLYSDSAYMVNGFVEGWVQTWRANGWLKTDGKPVANRLFWETLESQAALHDMTWIHMRGHGRGSEPAAWVAYNARADRLATAARTDGLAVNRLIRRKTATPPVASRGVTSLRGQGVG